MENQNMNQVDNLPSQQQTPQVVTNNQNIPQNKPSSNSKENFPLISLVLGISGLIIMWIPCCNVTTYIICPLAILFGFLSLKSEQKNMAIAGIVMGIIGIMIDIGLIFLGVAIGLSEFI